MTSRKSSMVMMIGTLVCGLVACGKDDAVAPTGSPGKPDWTPMESGTDKDISALWAASANDVFAVGAGGTILRYDGTVWKPLDAGTTDNLRGVWGTASDHVIATSELGAILTFNGSDWVPTTGVTTDPIGPVSGLDVSFVVAAGGGPAGSFLQFDGADWTVRSTGGSQVIADVAGIPGMVEPAAILVGNGGDAFFAQLDTVLAIETGTTTNLVSVFVDSLDDVIVVGDDGTVLAMDLTDFPTFQFADVRPLAGPSADLTGVVFRGYNDLFLCAADGSIFGFDRCSTRSLKSSGGSLFDMATVSTDRIMAVGEGGTILSYSKPAPAACPDAVSVSISAGTTPTFSWSPNCPVNLVLVEEQASDMWFVWVDGNVIEPGVRYGTHHPCEIDFTYEGPLIRGVEYDVILFRHDGPNDYTLIALKSFVP